VNGQGTAPVARQLARAAAARDFVRLRAHSECVQYAWDPEYDGDVLVTVQLKAQAPGYESSQRVDRYVVTLYCDSYDVWPPEVKFVDPTTRTYTVGATAYLPRIEGFPNLGIHTSFNNFYEVGRVDQLVCFSFTRGYYDSAHTPNADERWTQGRHRLFSTIKVLQRALQPAYYRGPLG